MRSLVPIEETFFITRLAHPCQGAFLCALANYLFGEWAFLLKKPHSFFPISTLNLIKYIPDKIYMMKAAFLLASLLFLSSCGGSSWLYGSIAENKTTGEMKALSSSVKEGTLLTIKLEIEKEVTKNTIVNLTYSNSQDSIGAPTQVTILAGQTEAEFSWTPPLDDVFQMSKKEFSITASSNTLADTKIDLEIENSDPFPNVTLNTASQYEGQSAIVFVTLSHPADQNLTFNYSFTDDTASSLNYDSTGGSVVVNAGDLTAQFLVPLYQDTNCDANKKFFINLVSQDEGALVIPSAEQIILENSAITYAFQNISLSEGSSGNVALSSDLSCPFDRTLVVSSRNGSAIAGVNYQAIASQTVLLPAHQTSVDIPVTTLADNLYAPTKTFEVIIDSSSFGDNLSPIGTISINNQDPAPTLSWSVNAQTVARLSSNTTLQVSWQLSAASGYDTTASIVLGGTAVSGVDYSVNSQSLSIPKGTVSGTFPVTIRSKTNYNGPQNVTLTLDSLDHATLGINPTHDITITDSVPVISLTNSVASVNEGNSTSITVNLSKTSYESITVDYATIDGTGVAGTDYDSTSGTLTFAAGESSKIINISTIDNSTICQNNRTFNVAINNPTNGTLGTTVSAIKSIVDDDDPQVTIDNVTVTEGNSATITATLSNACPYTTQFSWATVNGSAIGGVDYVSSSGILQFVAGATSNSFSISTTNDSLDKGNLSFSLALSNPSKLLLPPVSPNITILDNEFAPVLSLDKASDTISESTGVHNILIKLDHPTIADVTSILTFGGSAIIGTDYTVSQSSVLISAGGSSFNLQITPIRGSGGKNITVSLGAPNRGTLGPNSQYTLNIDVDPYTGPVVVVANDSSRALYLNSISGALPLLMGAPQSSSGFLLSKSSAQSPRVADFAFSGDSSRTIFISNNSRSTSLDIFSIKVNGTSLVQLNSLGWAENRNVQKMKVVGNTSKVIFSADRSAGGAYQDLYSVNADSSSLINLIPSLTGTKTIYSFDVSNNGSKVVFISDLQGKREIYSINPDGSSLLKINTAIATDASVEDFKITPDSSKVVFTVKNSGGEYLLYVAPIGSGGMTLINTVVSGRTVPSFKISADSAKVIYLHNSITVGSYDLFKVNINGSSRVQLSQGLVTQGSVKDFSFSPNSEKVLYLAETTTVGSPELYSINADSSSRYKLNASLPNGGKITTAEFLPDSSSVIYLGYQDSNSTQELYAVGLTGNGRVKLNLLPVSSGQIKKFIITNDSTKVIYLGDQDIAGMTEIYSVTIAGGSRSRISPNLSSNRKVDQISLLPDNTKLLYRANQDDIARYEWYSLNLDNGSSTKFYSQ